MGVREEEEEGGKGVFCKKVGEEFHSVGTDDGNVVIGCTVGSTESSNAICDVLCDLYADLQAENGDIRIAWSQFYEEAAKATANVSPFWRRGRMVVCRPVDKGWCWWVVKRMV